MTASRRNAGSDLDAGDTRALEGFLDAMWMEHGLADNTLTAYRSDLRRFSRWLRGNGTGLLATQRSDVLTFLASEAGNPAKTVARRLSTLRRFFRYQLREGRMRDDPCTLIASPRLGRPLPSALSEQEVERLLNTPDIDTAIGLRDKAMLEVLYATGLRVSELVSCARRRSTHIKAWCASPAKATRNAWFRWGRKRCTGSPDFSRPTAVS